VDTKGNCLLMRRAPRQPYNGGKGSLDLRTVDGEGTITVNRGVVD